jgi:predicted DCC family thiol-disulfide oxidoreductase YuxK
MAIEHKLVVVLDGECVMCSKFALFIASFSPDARLMWAQHEKSKQFLRKFDISYEDIMKSIAAIKDGKAYRGSDAFIQILISMPWYLRLMGYLMMLFPRFIREYIYGLVAVNRYTLFGKYETCTIPDASVRSKFLH